MTQTMGYLITTALKVPGFRYKAGQILCNYAAIYIWTASVLRVAAPNGESSTAVRHKILSNEKRHVGVPAISMGNRCVCGTADGASDNKYYCLLCKNLLNRFGPEPVAMISECHDRLGFQ